MLSDVNKANLILTPLNPVASLLVVLNVKLHPIRLVVQFQESDFHLINVFCVVIVVKKYIMSTSSSVIVFCTA